MAPRQSRKHQAAEQQVEPAQPTPRFSIDVGWYGARGRSLATLLARRMCPKHQRQWGQREAEGSPEKAIAVFKTCCAKEEDFLEHTLPLGEAAFRVLLAEGNRPLSAEEIAHRLAKWNTATEQNRDTSVTTLTRILSHDQFYGFRREEPTE